MDAARPELDAGVRTEDAIWVADAPVVVFGGSYSNLEATRSLLASARRLGVGPERIVCTGDTVAYCADPVATVALLREAGVHVVMGNCEVAWLARRRLRLRLRRGQRLRSGIGRVVSLRRRLPR